MPKVAPPVVIRRVCGPAGPDVRQACELVNDAQVLIERVVAPLFLTEHGPALRRRTVEQIGVETKSHLVNCVHGA
jgi:hypothetical protein